MKEIITSVEAANPARKISNITRRALKLSEETGEVSQAVVSVTSRFNSKGKTWSDVREELTDTIIVALDMLLIQFPDEEDGVDINGRIHAEFTRKLDKWIAKRDGRGDDVEG